MQSFFFLPANWAGQDLPPSLLRPTPECWHAPAVHCGTELIRPVFLFRVPAQVPISCWHLLTFGSASWSSVILEAVEAIHVIDTKTKQKTKQQTYELNNFRSANKRLIHSCIIKEKLDENVHEIISFFMNQLSSGTPDLSVYYQWLHSGIHT